MPRRHSEPRSPVPGGRVSVRRVRPDGQLGDIVGWVLDAGPAHLRLRDRAGVVHDLDPADVVAWRQVGVPRGRDPLRTGRAELDRLAGGAGGRVLVIRLSDLLDGREPPTMDAALPVPASVEGEWATSGACDDYVGLGWAAARADARSLQVRTDDPSAVAALLALGFTPR